MATITLTDIFIIGIVLNLREVEKLHLKGVYNDEEYDNLCHNLLVIDISHLLEGD